MVVIGQIQGRRPEIITKTVNSQGVQNLHQILKVDLRRAWEEYWTLFTIPFGVQDLLLGLVQADREYCSTSDEVIFWYFEEASFNLQHQIKIFIAPPL
jgi:hypothetical protein